MRRSQARGKATASPYGKSLIADSMYKKGTVFFASAGLLAQLYQHQRPVPEHVDYVFLHLLCQGIELVLKGLLLHRDFDKYHPLLKGKGGFGHNLYELAEEASSVYGMNTMRKPLADELHSMNNFYSKHRLRYGTIVDIFIDPSSIARRRVIRRFRATIKLAERGRPGRDR